MKADDLMYRDGLINNAAVNFVSRTGDLSHRAVDASAMSRAGINAMTR